MMAAALKHTVLAVDDCPENLDLIKNALEPHYHVKVALDGELALQVADTWQPDLILLDIMLGDIDGYEVCRRLKSSERSRNIPIIFLTSKSSETDEIRGFRTGCNDYITKPFSPSIVLTRVKTQIQLKVKTDLLEKLASLDGLTEIPNRRAFDSALERQFNQSKRSEIPLSLLILDIDYFKQFNDHYGHPAGDDCLKRVATVLTETTPHSEDLVARLGGEEFAILLPNTDNVGANLRAEQYRQSVENLKIPHASFNSSPYITISIGVATITAQRTDDLMRLFQAADNALYQAKTQGRNQSCSLNLYSN
jgi:diguanylate cyclase (GGDEF)-like protein